VDSDHVFLVVAKWETSMQPHADSPADHCFGSLFRKNYCCEVRPSVSGARRMLAMLGEMHQPLHLRPANNPGAA
jgi:hypothetical protein